MSSAGPDNRSTRAALDPEEGADYYAVLGVPYTAGRDEITRAYREAMKRAHPDHHRPDSRAAAEERAKTLNRAYATLRHAESRRAYDASIRARAVQEEIMSQYFGGFGMPGSGDPRGDQLRRERTATERRDQQRNDRQAMVSIVVVFAGATGVVLMALLLWSIAGAAIARLF